jgi:uncharacterized membrane protein YcaP (DUF421 family)
MGTVFGVDWDQLLAVEPPLAEMVLRGSLTYLASFAFLRLFKREAGSVGIADLLVLVLIADAIQNAMAGGYTTVTDGCILVSTIVGWNYALDWATYRFESVRRWSEPPPLPLVVRGHVLPRNLRREYITPEELDAKLREQGIENVSEVKRACLESDGQISVIKMKRDEESPRPQRKRSGAPS